MNKLRRKVYMTAGYNTVSMGTGRKEFHPKKPRPGLEHYIREAGRGVLQQIGGAGERRRGRDRQLHGRPLQQPGQPGRAHPGHRRGAAVEAVHARRRRVLLGRAGADDGHQVGAGRDGRRSSLAVGVEVQNTVKAIYGADILATAGWTPERKTGHAYFFPGKFSDRAGAYFEKYGRERTRKAMARWYRNAIENARLCPTAQEYHNATRRPRGGRRWPSRTRGRSSIT